MDKQECPFSPQRFNCYAAMAVALTCAIHMMHFENVSYLKTVVIIDIHKRFGLGV